MNMIELCEIAMLICFGLSWPFNIYKSAVSRTARGKSVQFEIIVIIGYLFGLAGKFLTYHRTGVLAYSVWFYFLDIAMVITDICLFIRNTRLDHQRDLEEARR